MLKAKIHSVSKATIDNWKRLWVDNFDKKLKSRANKTLSKKHIITDEYSEYSDLINIGYKYLEHGYTISEILYSIVLNLTKSTKNSFLKNELMSWETSSEKIIDELVNFDHCYNGDILGGIYQSLMTEWEKNIRGSYYTPDSTVKDIVKKWYLEWMKILDPCCWTGKFLLQIETNIPENIWGSDIDQIAVRIARINLIIKYSWYDFFPNIYCIDSLSKDSRILVDNYFDLILTNPPWWAKINSQYEWYPLIRSWEIFSFFIQRCIELLKIDGVLSCILPESILNVKVHEDIRAFILWYDIISIYELGRIFTNVFTPAIRIDIKKQNKNWNINIYSKTNYIVNKSLFINNKNYNFSIHMNDELASIIDKVYSKPSYYLNNENADWGLWIVTWNNQFFITNTPSDWYEPIYTWKEIALYNLLKPTKYILYKPENFQQIAPINRYRTTPKLVYKFISKKLVFSLDYSWSLTLNSANIVIPKIDYPIKVILALFNSELYQTIFQKKFNSIKVLKSHIQELPLPIFSESEIYYIENIINEIINTWKLDKKVELDAFIFNVLTK